MVNIRRYEELASAGLVLPAGAAAYAKRYIANSGRESHERPHMKLAQAYLDQLRAKPKVWQFYSQLQPSRIKHSNWRVMSAKQEASRIRRLGILIACSERGKLIPPLVWTKRPTK